MVEAATGTILAFARVQIAVGENDVSDLRGSRPPLRISHVVQERARTSCISTSELQMEEERWLGLVLSVLLRRVLSSIGVHSGSVRRALRQTQRTVDDRQSPREFGEVHR